MADITPSKLKEVLKASYTSFFYVGIFSFIVNMLLLTVPLYMLQIFDRVLASQNYDTLIYLTLIAIGALFVLGLLDIARMRVLVRVSYWFDNKLSPMALSRGADDVLMGGQYASQSLRDISTIRGFLSGVSVFALFDAPWTPLYLLVVVLLHPLLGVIAIVGAVVIFVLAILNELLTREHLSKANEVYIHNQMGVDKALNNAEVIQSMGMLPNVVNRWFRNNETVLKLQSKASDRAGVIVAMSKFIRLTLQLSILGFGAYLVLRNQITPGVMIAASIITARALAPIEQTIGTWKQWKGVRRAYARLKEYLDKPDIRGESTLELPSPQGAISVENVTYAPMGTRKPIVYNTSFSIEPGERLAIIGPSGAGKSTLARLMLGIWKPIGGAVRMDGANVFEWDRAAFGKDVGYLPQDVDLFNGSIRDNIARMGEGDDEKVIAAAKATGTHDMILRFPGGYDFQVGGFSLSGGQRQRIALARAFYGDPKFLVLDEPNASLDREGDEALAFALQKAHQRKVTTVIISHRPNLIQYVDKIVVMGQGQVQMYGPRDQVLQKLKEQIETVKQ